MAVEERTLDDIVETSLNVPFKSGVENGREIDCESFSRSKQAGTTEKDVPA